MCICKDTSSYYTAEGLILTMKTSYVNRTIPVFVPSVSAPYLPKFITIPLTKSRVQRSKLDVTIDNRSISVLALDICWYAA
jgi:hypothetical protein